MKRVILSLIPLLIFGCGKKYIESDVKKEEISVNRLGYEIDIPLFSINDSVNIDIQQTIIVKDVDYKDIRNMIIEITYCIPLPFKENTHIESIVIDNYVITEPEIKMYNTYASNYFAKMVKMEVKNIIEKELLKTICNDREIEINILWKSTVWGKKIDIEKIEADTFSLKEMRKNFSYYIDSFLLPVKNEYMISIAKQLKNSEKLLEILKNVYSFTMNSIEYYEKELYLSPQDAIKTGLGDCDDYTDIFVTLCRIIGIPSTDVFIGIVGELPDKSVGNDVLIYGFHAWPYVLLPWKEEYIWVPLDPTWDDNKKEWENFPAYDDKHLYRIYMGVNVKSGKKINVTEKERWIIYK